MNLNNDNNNSNSSDSVHTMFKIFCKQKPGLHLCHINSQSLLNKMDEFREIFDDSGVDIVCISETWFDRTLQDSFIAVNGYRVFRSDRSTYAGGVAMFVKSNIHCKVILKSDDNSSMEFLFLEIITHDQKTLIGTVYRRNNRIDLTPLIDTIEYMSVRYTKIIIAGDFNSDLIKDSSLKDKLHCLSLFPANSTINLF